MKRPQSAKHVRTYLAQTSNQDGVSFEQPTRHFIKAGKKHMFTAGSSSNDLSRLLPKKIQQDKEQLYYEALQLKNNFNQVNEENIRLKTKIALLQREKERSYKNEEQRLSKGGRSSNLLNASKNQKQNGIVNNLKKMVRQTREQNENLQNQMLKIKKNIKFTKINQIEIEKQSYFQENKKLAKLIQRYESQLQSRVRQDEQISQLQSQLNEKTAQLKEATTDNIKYEELLDQLQNQYRETCEKLLISEKKWQRNFAVQKRKVQQLNKHVELLRQQVKTLNQKLEEEKKRALQVKKQARPASSRPYQHLDSSASVQYKGKQKSEALQINQKLKGQIEQAKRQLAQSQNKLKSKLLNSSQIPNNIQVKQQEEQYQSDFQETTVKPQKKIVQEQPLISEQGSKVKNEINNFPIINEIKQILTYRMKYNRYTFKELKSDIQLSPLASFIYEDLFNMLTAEPFILSHHYAEQFLKICYGKPNIKPTDELNSATFSSKLRLVIDDFEQLDEEQQELMLYKIAELITKNRNDLEKQFKKLKDKNNCISKDQLIKALKGFSGVTQQEIALAICYISINTQTLQAINYQDFLDRFFINNNSKAFSNKNSKQLKDEDLSMGQNEDLDQSQLIVDDQLV